MLQLTVMMSMKAFVVLVFGSSLLLTSCQTQEQQSEDADLLLVQFLFRHGDRTPVVLYKTDHYTKGQFPEGLGQLTARGKERLLRYGQLLRQRYNQYIGNTLLRNVRAQSSPSRRCLESSLLLLAGLFPPSQPQVWSNHSDLGHLWQPIAVETTEKPRAWLLNSEATCPAATHIEDMISVEQPTVKKFLEEHREFIKKLEKYSGEDYSSWYDVGYLWDTLFTEKEYFGDKFVLPSWLELVGNDTWDRLYLFNEMEIGAFDLSPQYQRLRAGPFLKQIISNMNTSASIKTAITEQNRQVFTYASHDTMISYIIQALGFWKASPTFGSGLIIELRKDSSQFPQVHLFYANVTNNFDIHQLNLNESKTFSKLCTKAHCSLQDFAASLETFLPGDLEKECTKK